MMDTTYGGGSPFVPGSETSQEAAASMDEATKEAQRALVVAYLAVVGRAGATSDEVEAHTQLLHTSGSARLRDLYKAGRVARLTEKRKTRNNKNAYVHVLPEYVDGRETQVYFPLRSVSEELFFETFADMGEAWCAEGWARLDPEVRRKRAKDASE